MLALVFGVVSLIFTVKSQPLIDKAPLSDSVKRPVKNRPAVDSTARFLTINRIFIIGNKITRDPIILRELTLKAGDLIYSGDLGSVLESDKQKLINTRLFNTVNFRTLELEPGRVDLLVDIKERWYTFPSPIFDLADRNFNEWWENYNHDFKRVNYGLRLYQFNMRGRNETLKFTAQFGFLRKFDLSYRIPFIDRSQKHGLQIDVDFSEAKNVAFRTNDHKLEFIESEDIIRVTRGASLSYLFRNSFYESHSLRLEHRINNISDTLLFQNPNYFGDEKTQQQFSALTYQFTSEHRDYIGYPLRGYFFNAAITKSGFSSKEDLDKLEGTFNYSRYFDLKKGLYLSNNAVVYASTPRDLPYSNYGALGYRKTFVRGYEVYLIEGPTFLLNKTTLKKKIFSRTYHWGGMPVEQFRHIPLALYFKVYGDVGYVSNYDNYEIGNRLTNKLLSGVGAGFDLVGSYDAVFRFEYTYNAEGIGGFFFHLRKEF